MSDWAGVPLGGGQSPSTFLADGGRITGITGSNLCTRFKI